MNTSTQCNLIRITLVEDNVILRAELVRQLKYLGYQVKGVNDGIELGTLLQEEAWTSHIFILDVNLPGEDGFSIAQRLANPSQHAIIILTARIHINDKIQAFDQGADLYLTKPIDFLELKACINSLSRRFVHNINQSDWVLNLNTRLLGSNIKEKVLEFSTQDIKILEIFLTEPGEVVSREKLASLLEISGLQLSDYRINTSIYRLRKKLSQFDSDFTIHTWRRGGYSLLAPAITIKGHLSSLS